MEPDLEDRQSKPGASFRSSTFGKKIAGFRVRLWHQLLPCAVTAVDAFDQIRAFLSSVRRRLLRLAALRAALYAVAGAVGLSLAVPLLALALAAEHGHAVGIAGLIAGTLLVAGAVAAMLVPVQRWRGHRGMARYVGRQAPPLASDLLSSVELGSALDTAGNRASPALTRAFMEHTARRVTALDPGTLIPRAPLRRALWVCAGALGAGILLLLLAPSPLAYGWQRVLSRPVPGPFDGARLSATPLVGDIRILLEFPPYTGRPAQELPATSGDFRAMPGTSVTLETRPPGAVAAARMLFGDEQVSRDVIEQASRDVIMELAPDTGLLRAQFPVRGAATYRFWIERPDGERLVEALPRRIEIEPDQPPRVQLFAPADELDVTSLKRIELAYIAEDDYGIDTIDLVWKSQGRSERQRLTNPDPGRPSAQNKFLWDLAELSLEPGVPVTYHLEVADNDTVSGPKTTRSRSFVLRVFSPREKHEQMVARQRELFENMLRLLGQRLMVQPEDLRARQVLARDTAELVVEMGSLLAVLASDELADDALRQVLDQMRGRIDDMTKSEHGVLDKLAARPDAGPARPRSRGAETGRLAQSNKLLVTELEDDVILLANWLDRQQMENLLAISDEIKLHEDRLRQLFDELERTGDSAILAEIEREMRALEARLAEMAQSRGSLPEDVLDRFVHTEALQGDQARSCVDEARVLLASGNAEAARRKMESCMQTLDQAASAMEMALRQLRGDSFGEQERRFGQLMNDLADLARDQQDVAADADALWEQYAARADELMRDKTSETRRQVARTLDKLRRRLDRIPESGLTPFAKEELEIIGVRLEDLDEMLADGDLAEALSIARQVREGIDVMAEELGAALLDEQHHPWGGRTGEAEREVQRARPLARTLVEELEAQTPSPEEIMTPEDRRLLERLRRRQEALAERARRLAEKAGQAAEQLPGRSGQAMADGLAEARPQMGRAADRMRQRDPSGARHESRSAAETLQRAMEGAQGAARQRQAMDRAGLRDEPIRIPGADEYRPPEEFREDILEAMKREQAPDGFGELVKRYYEELIR